ncbi:MAG: IPT/TIG domain-containing protein [Ignavibacteriota bacterium]
MTIGGVTNSASGAVGPLAPGELVSIYGTGLGPASGVPFTVNPTTGGVDTTLGGTKVLFGSVAAPITYASATQVNAVVPYEMAGQSQISMRVQSQAGSASQTVQIASAAPGVFMLTTTGFGQAAAVNLDYSINGPDHPRGEELVRDGLFHRRRPDRSSRVTGSVTGLVLKWLTQPVSVTVGNQPATAQFCGAAPTDVDGVNQLNIQLASNTPSGAQPVVITVGGVTSPSTATIYVQ